MNKTEKKEAIKKKFQKFSESIKKQLKFEEDYALENDKKADLALIDTKTDRVHSLWKIEDNVEYTDQEQRTYFHQKGNPFMGCGVDSKFWVYSDGEHYVLNDHSYVYPFDEHYKTLSGLFKRMEKQQ